MDIVADIGGSPGIDCQGFCKYCYFKSVKEVLPFGCKHCFPFQKGCDYCTRSVKESYPGFNHPQYVVQQITQSFHLGNEKINKITISGGGDISCYPGLFDLVKQIAQFNTPIHLGYTSGKGFKDKSEAHTLIEYGVKEVSYTVFATDLKLRREYMNDKNAQASIDTLKVFCEQCDVYAAIVIVPGVNDGKVLDKTLKDLEDFGAKGAILMRFANESSQGLILENAPILSNIKPQTIEEFVKTVHACNDKFDLRISATPLEDPLIGSPFAIRNNKNALSKLPKVSKAATLITGLIAAPRIAQIFNELNSDVNIVPLNKDISCLITIDDFKHIDLKMVKETVILPGRVFAHDSEMKNIFLKDGIDRLVRRGPESLTYDGEISISMKYDEVIDFEIQKFTELIEQINAIGT